MTGRCASDRAFAKPAGIRCHGAAIIPQDSWEEKRTELKKLRLGGIPALLWGGADRSTDRSSRSSELDDCIWGLAGEAVKRGCQVLSFDLPQYGGRAGETDLLMPDECVRELHTMYAFGAEREQRISLFGCSMGACFGLPAFADADIERAWFLSPVTDMERIIHGL